MSFAESQPEGQSLQLQPGQLELVAALQECSGQFDFAAMYLGALYVLKQTDNPIRFVLAAHALRELMEKLPESFGDLPRSSATLKQRTQNLGQDWETARRSSKCWVGDRWEGEIDRSMQKGLRKIEEFLAAFATDYPKRAEQAGTFLERVEHRPTPLPETILREHVQNWRDCHSYFQSVGHQRSDRSDFEAQLVFLEQFLLARLAPKTHRDRSDIDAIISRGEG